MVTMKTQNTVIIYRSDRTGFDLASQDIAKAMLTSGNAEGYDRACHWPENMVATMKQGRGKTVLELIWPNGDTLVRHCGRVDAKRVARELVVLGIKVLNFKKGGGMVELSA
jgi:hypothetical protein